MAVPFSISPPPFLSHVLSPSLFLSLSFRTVQRNKHNGMYPVAYIAHAGTIIGDELNMHGGMHFGNEHYNRRSLSSSTSSFVTPPNLYATHKTTLRWHPLSGVWLFNLVTLRWKEKILCPQLARSYHSVVGWGDGTIAAFGTSRTMAYPWK